MNFTLQNWPEEHKLDLANQLELITSRKPGLHLQETRTKRWSSWRKRSSWQPGMMTDQPVRPPPPSPEPGRDRCLPREPGRGEEAPRARRSGRPGSALTVSFSLVPVLFDPPGISTQQHRLRTECIPGLGLGSGVSETAPVHQGDHSHVRQLQAGGMGVALQELRGGAVLDWAGRTEGCSLRERGEGEPDN